MGLALMYENMQYCCICGKDCHIMKVLSANDAFLLKLYVQRRAGEEEGGMALFGEDDGAGFGRLSCLEREALSSAAAAAAATQGLLCRRAWSLILRSAERLRLGIAGRASTRKEEARKGVPGPALAWSEHRGILGRLPSLPIQKPVRGKRRNNDLL